MMDETERVWRAQHERMNRQLREAGALREESDGFRWIDREVMGETFMTHYARSAEIGYWRGWI